MNLFKVRERQRLGLSAYSPFEDQDREDESLVVDLAVNLRFATPRK
jgi:hypothetical protein